MTIRPYSWRRAVALLLTAACAGGGGCRSTPLNLAPLELALAANDDRPDSPSATKPDASPAPTAEPTRSPAESYRACLTTAREMEAHGDHAAAIEQYERAREFAPAEPGIAVRLAALHERAANHDRAAAEYAIALKEDPTNADLWNDFAHYQFQRTEFVAAEVSARRALVLDPSHRRAWVTLGLIEAELERYDDALASLTHAVSPAAAHNDLGIILARQGHAELAAKQFAAARRLDPTLKQPPNSLPPDTKRTAHSSSPVPIKRS